MIIISFVQEMIFMSYKSQSSWFCFLMLFLVFSACVPEVQKELTTVSLDVKSNDFYDVLELTNKDKTDSLALLLNDKDPTKRYLASRAFCSISSLLVADSLLALMDDPVIDVRTMAVKAIGQLGNTAKLEGLVSAFRAKDTSDVNNPFNAAILESVGKLGSEKYLNLIATTKTYRDSDDNLILGQARAIYQFALRDITSEAGTNRMVDILTNKTFHMDARLMSALYLERAKNINLDAFKFRLAEVFTKEPNPSIRMSVAKAMGKINDPEILSYLKNQYKIEKDYRVKLNIIDAYKNFAYIDVVDDIFALIKDEDYRIGLAASQYLKTNGVATDAMIYKTALADSLDKRIVANVYEAILTTLPHYYVNSKNVIRRDILTEIDSTKNVYLKADFIRALGKDPLAYVELKKLLENNEDPVVNTAIADAYKSILANDKFDYVFKSGARYVRKEILAVYETMLELGDAGMSAVVGTSLANPQSQLKPLIDSLNFVEDAINNLNIPKEIESYDELQKALAYLKDVPYVKGGTKMIKPIDWASLRSVSDSTIIVIKTNKGNISFKPYPQRAPESVANFIALVNDNFYDGKVFHRVVPNFVIQTGCPRGDGYGGMDYTIHSELADAIYDDEGYLGMASAGKDTESSQWFITHRPTPHLDMKYTIFGKVTEGMKVVHAIEVGDKIVDIIITN